MGLQGGMMQMVSHGLISGALFLCVGVLYDRMHSREISAYGGVANTMPKFAAFMVLFAMANAGLPGTSGFVGEFLVILASFKASFWYAFLAATTLMLGAAYTLWMVKRVLYGEVANDRWPRCRISAAARPSCSASSRSRCCCWACGRRPSSMRWRRPCRPLPITWCSPSYERHEAHSPRRARKSSWPARPAWCCWSTCSCRSAAAC
jgi:NADH:ubiquinone oxidoreductase subunit 5 (subunit L)/multisubunit Na+/H+ antiporter MnhA subunit